MSLPSGLPNGHQGEDQELTFKQRVEAFWTWYASVAERFHRTIGEKQCSSLGEEVSATVDKLLPGMGWVFGPGKDPTGHSFTLTGEGILPKQLLAAYWLSRAPELDGWTFHAGRQASDIPREFSLEMGAHSFRPIEFWVTPEINEEKEKVDVTVWHPLAGQVPEKTWQTALFLMLDEILGEFGTDRWIGATEFGKAKLGASMPITELREFVESASKEQGWQMNRPGTTWSTYKLKREPDTDSKPRLDTIAGSTACWKPLRDFFHDPDDCSDPFAGFHADWVYLSFDSSVLAADDVVNAREDIAEIISTDLGEMLSGRHLGGAIGVSRTYIDFLIYDGDRSIGIIREAARRAGLPDDTRLEYLASSKRDLGISLFGS